MNDSEIISFIQKMYKDFPKMPQISNEEYKVWKDTLSKLPKDIVDAKYIDHKSNPNYKNNPPSIMLFSNYKEEKQEEPKKILMKCPKCGKYLYYDAMILHESRHRSINYINSRLERFFNKTLDKQKIQEYLNMNQEEFDKRYDEFLDRLVPYLNQSELERVLRIKYSKEHPMEKIPVDIKAEYKDFLGEMV